MKQCWSRSLAIFVYGVLSSLIMSGCATITKGSSQSVTINTNPSGALCTLSREGNTIAFVNPTPGTVNIEKDKDTISVICKKDGFNDCAGTLSAEIQGMTFGNILFGGIIGVAVDAGSGALHKYPPMLTLLLIPKEFNSVAERDIFFEGVKADRLSEHSKAMASISGTCGMESDDKRDYCQSQMKAAEASLAARLAEIDNMRNLAIVRN